MGLIKSIRTKCLCDPGSTDFCFEFLMHIYSECDNPAFRFFPFLFNFLIFNSGIVVSCIFWHLTKHSFLSSVFLPSYFGICSQETEVRKTCNCHQIQFCTDVRQMAPFRRLII